MKIPPPAWDPSIHEYHALPLYHSISSTSLRLFMRDREAFQQRMIGDMQNAPRDLQGFEWRVREAIERERSRPKSKTKAQDLGGALGGYFLDKREYQERMDRLTKGDRETVDRMAKSIERAPVGTWAGRIFRYLKATSGRSEWSYCFTHASGIPCRIRCDRIVGHPGKNLITNMELKSSRRDSPSGFLRDILEFMYYIQLALQDNGIREAFPDCEVESLWGFISSKPPHRCCILRPDPVKMEEARASIDEHLFELAELSAKPFENWGPRREPWEVYEPGGPLIYA